MRQIGLFTPINAPEVVEEKAAKLKAEAFEPDGIVLLLAKETADLIGINTGQLAKWHSQLYGPPHIKLGDNSWDGSNRARTRYHLQDVLKFIAAHRARLDQIRGG